jgi:hypothetical protein
MKAVSIILFGFASLSFAGVYTSMGGILTDFDSYSEQGVGWHWIATAIPDPGRHRAHRSRNLYVPRTQTQ